MILGQINIDDYNYAYRVTVFFFGKVVYALTIHYDYIYTFKDII